MRSATSFLLVPLLLLILASPAVAGWAEDLDRVLDMAPGEDRNALAKTVAEAAPDAQAVTTHILARKRPDATTGMFVRKRKCSDGVERHWVLFVPEGYDPAKPTPLLVTLHGLITREELISDPGPYAERSFYTKLGRARGWLVAFPFGQKGATWFDDVGMANVRDIVRTIKRERNVDDDRVWMAGFSDGASAAFSYAMVEPNDYGAFLSLNGHMGVASEYAGIETFAPNMANTPVYVMTSDRDSLYATAKMRPTIEMAIRAGGRIFFRQFYGVHDYTHVHPELANLGDYLERHPRNPHPGRIVWETADPERFGLCRWFGIDKVSSVPAASWHGDHNVQVNEDRISIGFQLDRELTDAIKVTLVVEDSFAEGVGLAVDDVLLEVNGIAVSDLDQLNEAKKSIRHGKEVTLLVKRGENRVTLTGTFPAIKKYWVFTRKLRSALAYATFSANHVTVNASRVGALRILVHPAMVNLSDPLVVTVNGKKVLESSVEPDVAFLLENYLENRDRKLLYVNEVKVEIP